MRWRTPDKPYRTSQDSLKEFDQEGLYLATVKYDGFRCVIDWDGKDLEFLSRRGMDKGGPSIHPVSEELRLETLAFLKENKVAPNSRLDGEWVCRRTLCEPKIVIFGIQYSNGKWLGKKPEGLRWEIISSLRYEQPHILLAEAVEDDYSGLFERSKNRDLARENEDLWETEGIVLKHINSKLIGNSDSNKKNPLWFKVKWRDAANGKYTNTF